MTKKSNNITDMPFASWLEQTLHDIQEFPVRGIAIALTGDNGDMYTNYYNVTMADKILISGLINQDATLDMMAANGIISYAEDEEDNNDGEKEERD